MMVGSLEVDIQDVQNSIDNRDVIDDFDDDNDERTTYNFHKMEVVYLFILYVKYQMKNNRKFTCLSQESCCVIYFAYLEQIIFLQGCSTECMYSNSTYK